MITVHSKLANALKVIRTIDSPVKKLGNKNYSTRSRERGEENDFSCPFEAVNFMNQFVFDNLKPDMIRFASKFNNFRSISLTTVFSDVRLKKYQNEAVKARQAFKTYILNENKYLENTVVLPAVATPNHTSVVEIRSDNQKFSVIRNVDYLENVCAVPVASINTFQSLRADPLMQNVGLEDALRSDVEFSIYAAAPFEQNSLQRTMFQVERHQHAFSVDELADAVRSRVDSRSTNVGIAPSFSVLEFLTTVLCFNTGGENRRNFRVSETRCTPLLLRIKSQNPVSATVYRDFEDVLRQNSKATGVHHGFEGGEKKRLALNTQALQFWMQSVTGIDYNVIVYPKRVKVLLDSLTVNMTWDVVEDQVKGVPGEEQADFDARHQDAAFDYLKFCENGCSAKNLVVPKNYSGWDVVPVLVGNVKETDLRERSAMQPFSGQLRHDDGTCW